MIGISTDARSDGIAEKVEGDGPDGKGAQRFPSLEFSLVPIGMFGHQRSVLFRWRFDFSIAYGDHMMMDVGSEPNVTCVFSTNETAILHNHIAKEIKDRAVLEGRALFERIKVESPLREEKRRTILIEFGRFRQSMADQIAKSLLVQLIKFPATRQIELTMLVRIRNRFAGCSVLQPRFGDHLLTSSNSIEHIEGNGIFFGRANLIGDDVRRARNFLFDDE